MTTALNVNLRRAAARLAPDPAPDGELLARFLASRDEGAFAAVVRRHAGMVFGTCRRVLGNAADADDAFQAAFVVLVRKAHSLTDRACVGNFLYGVAFHTALKARAMATKRRAKEAKATRPESADGGELTRVLDEELAKLPDKYREPVVLCELDGVSRKDAAVRLGIPEGTVSSRLATAHRMLHKRLAARGFAAVAVAAVLENQAFAVPDGLAEAAVRAAADGPQAGVTLLATEVSKMLLWNKLKAGVVLTGVLLACGIGFGVMVKGFADDRPAVKAPPPAKEARKPDDAKLLQGKWVTKAVTYDPPFPVQPGETHTPAHHTLTFTDAELTWESYSPAPPPIPGRPPARNVQTKPFKLDQTTSPKQLTSGDTECVYELDGDSLKVAMHFLTPGRPKGFNAKDSPPGKGHIILIELTREKEEPKPEADKSYSLKDGEVLKLIPAPFPEDRKELVRLQKDLKHIGDSDRFLLSVTIENGKPEAVAGGMSRGSTRDKPGIRLSDLFTGLLRYDLISLSDPDWLLQSTTADCDVLLKKAATPDEWMPALQKELKAKCGVELVLEFREVETEAIVITGKHTFKPVRGDYDFRKSNASVVTLFTSNKRQVASGRADGTSRQLPGLLAQFLGRPVVDESDLTSNEVAMGLDYAVIQPSTIKGTPVPGTTEAVFADMEKQTGLTFKLEKRKVKALVVKAKPDTPEADKSYSLKDGEALKLIPAPFPKERDEVFGRIPANKRTGSPADNNLLAVAVGDGTAEVSEFAARRWKDGDPVKPPQLLHYVKHLLKIDTATVSDPDWLLESTVLDADVVLRTGAKPDELLTALSRELKAKCGIDLTLTFREVETEVVVLSGKHTLKRNHAFPGRPYNDAARVSLMDKPLLASRTGGTAQLPAELATFLGRPVVDESDLRTNDVAVWIGCPDYDVRPQAKDRDAEKVLKSFADQTGLTYKLEKRKARALVVAKVGK